MYSSTWFEYHPKQTIFSPHWHSINVQLRSHFFFWIRQIFNCKNTKILIITVIAIISQVLWRKNTLPRTSCREISNNSEKNRGKWWRVTGDADKNLLSKVNWLVNNIIKCSKKWSHFLFIYFIACGFTVTGPLYWQEKSLRWKKSEYFLQITKWNNRRKNVVILKQMHSRKIHAGKVSGE